MISASSLPFSPVVWQRFSRMMKELLDLHLRLPGIPSDLCCCHAIDRPARIRLQKYQA